jgi:hypothetical protein
MFNGNHHEQAPCAVAPRPVPEKPQPKHADASAPKQVPPKDSSAKKQD